MADNNITMLRLRLVERARELLEDLVSAEDAEYILTEFAKEKSKELGVPYTALQCNELALLAMQFIVEVKDA